MKTFTLKTATAALGVAALLAGFGGAAPASAAPDPVTQSYNYDGYCYVKKQDLAGRDAALGAIGGAIAGDLLGKKGDKGKDALVGAAVGGGAGYVIGKNSTQKARCSKGRYYVYDHGYYAPPQAPRGFTAIFFEERPTGFDLYVLDRHGRAHRYYGD